MNTEDGRSNMLDLLLALVENAKLLILGPVVAGLATLAVTFLLPQKFVSEAILALPAPTSNGGQSAAQVASLMRSPLVLDPVIAAFDLAKGKSSNIARRDFAENIKVIVGKDGLLRLELTGPSPDQAQTLANAVIDAWLKTTKPAEQDRRDLETRLSYAKSSLDGVTALLTRLSKESAGYLAQPLSRGEAGTTLSFIGELQTRYVTDVLIITRALQGQSRVVVIQAPTLPVDSSSPKKAQITGLAVLAAGFVMLIWVLIRRSWLVLAAQPRSADKLARLRAAIKLQ